MTDDKDEALRLADALENLEATGWGGDCFALTDHSQQQAELAATMLRSQHARIAELEAELAEQCRINGAGAERELSALNRVRELETINFGLTARLDRAVKAAEEHFGESAIRYKFSLYKNGQAMNTFPPEVDGKWFALQRADNDAHIGLCDRVAELEAVARVALEALKHVDDCTYVESGYATLALINIYEPEHVDGAIESLRKTLGEA